MSIEVDCEFPSNAELMSYDYHHTEKMDCEDLVQPTVDMIEGSATNRHRGYFRVSGCYFDEFTCQQQWFG